MGAMVLTAQEAEQFLYQEARLLDERRFEQWLELFTADGIYWIPIDVDADPHQESSIIFDDAVLRRMRVHHLLHERNFAQTPPSITVHHVTNVEVFEAEHEQDAIVRCNLIVYELRGGDHSQYGLGKQQCLTGRCEYLLREDDGWRISLKKVILINRFAPLPNLAFLL